MGSNRLPLVSEEGRGRNFAVGTVTALIAEGVTDLTSDYNCWDAGVKAAMEYAKRVDSPVGPGRWVTTPEFLKSADDLLEPHFEGVYAGRCKLSLTKKGAEVFFEGMSKDVPEYNYENFRPLATAFMNAFTGNSG